MHMASSLLIYQLLGLGFEIIFFVFLYPSHVHSLLSLQRNYLIHFVYYFTTVPF